MSRMLTGVVLAGAAALLAACDSAGVAQVNGDEAVLCPGGSNCPADQNYVGLLLPSDSFVAAAPADVVFAKASLAGAQPNSGGTAAAQSGPNATATARKKLCPQGGHTKCLAGESGLEWTTAEGQIQCDPGRPCVPGATHGPKKDGKGPPMPAGYAGWLCKKSAQNPCSDLPQRR